MFPFLLFALEAICGGVIMGIPSLLLINDTRVVFVVWHHLHSMYYHLCHLVTCRNLSHTQKTVAFRVDISHFLDV